MLCALLDESSRQLFPVFHPEASHFEAEFPVFLQKASPVEAEIPVFLWVELPVEPEISATPILKTPAQSTSKESLHTYFTIPP